MASLLDFLPRREDFVRPIILAGLRPYRGVEVDFAPSFV